MESETTKLGAVLQGCSNEVNYLKHLEASLSPVTEGREGNDRKTAVKCLFENRVFITGRISCNSPWLGQKMEACPSQAPSNTFGAGTQMKRGQKKEREKEGRKKDEKVEQRRRQVKRAEHNMADTGRGRRKQK